MKAMNNFETFSLMCPERFWEKIENLIDNPLRKYIDYVAWLQDTDRNILSFVKTIGKCRFDNKDFDLLERFEDNGKEYYTAVDFETLTLYTFTKDLIQIINEEYGNENSEC